MRQRPTIRQLEYFLALAKHLNFRKAAEACFVMQPTLSTQIKQLEQNLGVALFERDKRRVLLTQPGEALVGRACGVLDAVDELLDVSAGSESPLTGPLRLGVIPTIAPYLLPRSIRRIRERFPELRLYLREDTTEKLLELLSQGQLDVLLLAREAELGEVDILELFSDRFLLAVPKEHRLGSLGHVRECDLKDERLILLEDGH